MIEWTKHSVRAKSYGAAFLVCLGALPAAADTDAAAAFYQGRGVILISGAAPAAGPDAPPHLVARHLERHLPGAPTVSLITLPGAGGRRVAQDITQTAARDGRVIAALERGVTTSTTENAYGWIGAFAPDTGLVIARSDAGLAVASDLLNRKLVVGSTAP